MRINKYIASSGICSRRAAEDYIKEERVTVNGELACLSTTVEQGDVVELDGVLVKPVDVELYILLNKPVGITCTTERHIKGNIIDYVNIQERIFPIGRLDKDSTGLIVLTNQGDIVNEVLREENGHSKEYTVKVNKQITDDFIEKMSQGVKIYNPVANEYVVTKACKMKKLNAFEFQITLTQGYNRQIRRMCKAFDYQVTKLTRNRFLNLTLKDLPVGKWRKLSDEEMNEFKKQAKIG